MKKLDAKKSYLEFLTFNSGAIVFLSLFYYSWFIPKGLASLVFILVNVIWLLRNNKEILDVLRRVFKINRTEFWGYGFAVTALCFDFLLLIFVVIYRTDNTLVSPWDILPSICFVFYGLGWIYAILAFRYLNRLHGWLLAMFQYSVTFCLIAIIYSLGFGYDAFVHEATLKYIFEHGVIFPKQPFYIGQYMSLLPWMELFRISIKNLQLWFLPVLSGVLLATSVKVFYKNHKPDYWVIGLMLFAPLTFTVPYNYSLLLFIVAILLIAMNNRYSNVAALSVSVAALLIHPLVGIPAFIVSLLSFIRLKIKKLLWFITVAVISGGSLYCALLLYNYLHGGQVLFPNIPVIIDSIKIIFRSPAEFSWDYPWLSLLYVIYALWPHVLFVLGVYGLYKNFDKRIANLLFGSALGILLAAILAASSLRYKNIIVHEQYEFSYRLLSLLPWLVLPGLLSVALMVKARLKKIQWYFASTLILGLLLVMNWYVSYPQYNKAMHYYMPSISQDEIDIVNWIEMESNKNEYTALAPQLVSAAALRTIGFERSLKTVAGDQYPYPIPTGGALYQIYLDFLTGRNIEDSLKAASEFSPNDFLVLVVPYSWDPYGVLNNYLSNIANKQTIIGEMGVFIINTQ